MPVPIKMCTTEFMQQSLLYCMQEIGLYLEVAVCGQVISAS